MGLILNEPGIALNVINFDLDGNEIHTGVIDPLDISHVRCTYIPTFAKSVTYTPSISVRVVQTAIPRIVIHTGLAKTATYTPAIAKHGSYTPTIQRTGTP